MVIFKGKETNFSQLAKLSGVSWSQLKRRYLKGLRDDELIAPTNSVKVCFKGELLTITEAARISGMPYTTLLRRYHSGLRNDALFNTENLNVGNKKAANKLTDTQAREIYRKAHSGHYTQYQIAKLYGIDQSHVSDIKNGKRWV